MTENKKWDAYIYGDVNIDLVIPGVDTLPKPGQEAEALVMDTFVGGGAALFAMGLGKLGLHPVFDGLVGDDCYGDMIRSCFADCHVDDALLRTVPGGKTGISISFTNEKDRCFLTFRGTNQDLTIKNISMEQVAGAGHIHVTGYEGSKNHELYEELLKAVKEKTKATVSFDVGWDPEEEWSPAIFQLFPFIDVLFMNETEAVHYGRKDSAAEAALDFARYSSLVVVKMGKNGAVAVKNNKIYISHALQVQAVDTTGAGDSFNAGFIYGYLSGMDVEACLRSGNICGSSVVTKLGGNTAFPEKEQLFTLLHAAK